MTFCQRRTFITQEAIHRGFMESFADTINLTGFTFIIKSDQKKKLNLAE
jgi:hypothetical protein